MIDKIITFALQQRFLILVFTALFIGIGVYSAKKLPIDAFPDVTNIQVQIITQAEGMAPTEVERLVSFPIEVTMTGLPKVTEVRSLSKIGLSVVTIVFEDDVDIYFARQLVFERLQQAKENLPPGIDAEMGPISTGLGEIYQYEVDGDGYNPMELRTIQDWIIRPILRTVPGVTDVNSFGGLVKQYQVLINPQKLISHNLTLREVFEAVEKNNANAGGNFIEHNSEQYIVRGLGLVKTTEDLKNIIITSRDGTPIFVKDVANVMLGPEVRQGAVTKDGKGEVVTGIVLMLKGASGREVVTGVKEKVKEIQKALPPGVTIKSFYDRTDLVKRAIGTVTKALEEGAIFIFLVLLLFLGNIRSALIVGAVLPLSALFTFIMMERFNLSANLMSLGGLAIGIGMLVDGAVVMVENVYRHLEENPEGRGNITHTVLEAAKEVGRPIVFGISIIIAVFLPLFTLQGIEGKMFSPMAFTVSFALLGSLIFSLTVIPILCTFLLGEKRSRFVNIKVFDRLGGLFESLSNKIITSLKNLYIPILRKALSRRKLVVGGAALALIISLSLFPFIGTEFLPQLNEGSIALQAFRLPSISLTESLEVSGQIERALMKFPEVETVVSKTGRAEIASDPMGVEISDIIVNLMPQSDWKIANSNEELVEKMREDLSLIPGVAYSFSQPIALRVDELISGVKAQIAIKLFGDDMDVLKNKAEQIREIMSKIKGVEDLNVERVSGLQYLQIDIDRSQIARYGINVSDIQEIVETAIGGKVATEVFEGQKRFGVLVRFPEDVRKDVNTIKNILVSTPNGARIPLEQLARVYLEEGPAQISRENGQRRIVIECNVQGRDIGGFVAEAQKKIASKVQLPPGYFIDWGGQFENQQRAMARLYIVVPLVILLIFLLLFSTFNSLKNALLIIMNIPFAVIGGVLALFISGLYLSVSASVGFIALFGVAVLNGVVMVSYFNQLRREGVPLEEAIIRGAELRLRPVLMTALVASLGLVPMLIATGPGSEIQRPLGTVVIGGLISSTILTLVVLPTLYGWFEKKEVEF
ncbi:MAG TPA: efflux RND transporter permease subunit [Thermodesulfobacteriota bacterium]|nr:efflux RND transporter permease subunit [Thermodesulfobacteriota bacterium]